MQSETAIRMVELLGGSPVPMAVTKHILRYSQT